MARTCLVAPNLRCRCSICSSACRMRRRASSSAIFLLSLRSLSSKSRMRLRSSSTYSHHKEGASLSWLPADLGLCSGQTSWGSFLHGPLAPPALTSALALRSAAMSCTLSRCSLGADLYMSSNSFISFWLSWAFLREEGLMGRAGGHLAGVRR